MNYTLFVTSFCKDTKFSGNAGYGGGFFAPGFHIRIF